jgi:hypothetical protein
MSTWLIIGLGVGTVVALSVYHYEKVAAQNRAIAQANAYQGAPAWPTMAPQIVWSVGSDPNTIFSGVPYSALQGVIN